MTHNMITVKGIEQILLLVVDSDPELKSSRPYGEFRVNNKRTEVYPVLFYEFQSGSLSKPQQKYNRTITMAIGVALSLIEGRINEVDMKSRAHAILEKTIIKLREAPEFAAVGIKFTEKDIVISNLDEQGDDLITGVFSYLTFTLPVDLCIEDLPYLPMGSQANTYEPGNPSSLFCSLIADCPIIEEIQDDITLLFTLTGGTGSAFVCSDLLGCTLFTGLSAQTQSLSAITSLHTTQIIELQGLTGGTGGGVGTLEQVTASGNTADRSIYLQGDGSGFDLERKVIFRELEPILSGASDASIGINYLLTSSASLVLESPGPIFHYSKAGIQDSSAYPSISSHHSLREITGYAPIVEIGFMSASTGVDRMFNYLGLGEKDITNNYAGGVLLMATGTSALVGSSYTANLPAKSGTIAMLSDIGTITPGLNLYVGGTATNPIVGLEGEVVVTALTASSSIITHTILGENTGNGYGITGIGKTQPGVFAYSYSGVAFYANTDAVGEDLAIFNNGFLIGVKITNDGGLQWTSPTGAATTKANLGINETYVQPGTNILTGGTPFAPIVSVVPSPLFVNLTASTLQEQTYNTPGGLYYRGPDGILVASSDLAFDEDLVILTVAGSISAATVFEHGQAISALYAPISVQNQWVRPGVNAYTGGTANAPIVGVIGSPSFTAVTATNFISGSTNLNQIFAPIGAIGASTYVQPGLNITTGGTASTPIVNLSGSISLTSVTASNFISGGTNLSSVFAPIGVMNQFVQPGLNITTGGTASAPVVNLSGSISLTSVTASNFISGGTNLSSVFAPISVQNQWLQNGTNITTGGTANAPSANLSANISLTSVSATTFVEGGTLLSNKYAPKDLTITRASGTYILTLTDDSRVVYMSAGTAQNVVIPRNSAVALPIGSQVAVVQTGVGQVQFSADTGVSILSYSSLVKLAGLYAGASLVKSDTNEWSLVGNLVA